jgi:hypothetical protein
VSQACPLFLVFPGTSSTPLSPLSSARNWDRAPSSNRFRIAAYLNPRVGPQGTWGRDIRILGFITLRSMQGMEAELDKHRKAATMFQQAIEYNV